MTATLTPIPTVPAPFARETIASSNAPHGTTPVTAAESAQALRPVDPGSRTADLRLPTGRDRPVGPPPTFEINVLEDLRARMSDPPTPDDPLVSDETDAPRDDPAVPDLARPQRDAVDAETLAAPTLDRKV